MPTKALDSVPDTFVRGLMDTSRVAFEGCSAANRTSIGAERDATASVKQKAFARVAILQDFRETHRKRTVQSRLCGLARRRLLFVAIII
jgi:hypothetical protein